MAFAGRGPENPGLERLEFPACPLEQGVRGWRAQVKNLFCGAQTSGMDSCCVVVLHSLFSLFSPPPFCLCPNLPQWGVGVAAPPVLTRPTPQNQ